MGLHAKMWTDDAGSGSALLVGRSRYLFVSFAIVFCSEKMYAVWICLDWQWQASNDSEQDRIYQKILEQFLDYKNSLYSVHQIGELFVIIYCIDRKVWNKFHLKVSVLARYVLTIN